ncbi:hypothetical protein [Lachnospira multipara]|uniref:hypothetical protein n=1 Tax=Lachnospira multipara TaxID=28051 RepID=UPI0012DD9F14|nr:hypothetical protein [Lachnospira multipara]
MNELKYLYDFRNELEEQLELITTLMRKSRKNLMKYKDMDNTSVYISKSNGCIQFYLYDKYNKKKNYVRKSDVKNIKKYIQRDYDVRVNEVLSNIHASLTQIVEQCNVDDIYKEYENLDNKRKNIVIPIINTRQEYIDEWYTLYPGMQNTFPIEGTYVTEKNEKVRSKSEKIIADMLYKYDIPYVYEPRLELSPFTAVFPDFAIMNKRTGKTYYWEHLGLVSDIDYAIKNFLKLQEYISNGVFPGRDLILSIESENKSLDVISVDKMIKEYLL